MRCKRDGSELGCLSEGGTVTGPTHGVQTAGSISHNRPGIIRPHKHRRVSRDKFQLQSKILALHFSFSRNGTTLVTLSQQH